MEGKTEGASFHDPVSCSNKGGDYKRRTANVILYINRHKFRKETE